MTNELLCEKKIVRAIPLKRRIDTKSPYNNANKINGSYPNSRK
jgi:hypothetical protein